VLKVNTFKTWV